MTASTEHVSPRPVRATRLKLNSTLHHIGSFLSYWPRHKFRVDFMPSLMWLPVSPMEQLWQGPTEVQLPMLAKKFAPKVLWLLYSVSISTGDRSCAGATSIPYRFGRHCKPLDYKWGSQFSSNWATIELPLPAVSFKCLLLTYPLCI